MLSDIIKEKIRNEGPISFYDFMEMALYYPRLGYYTSAEDRIGIRGDYFTSSNLTPVFGAMIARQLEQMWQIAGGSAFTIVEYGAGNGFLCHDILDYLKQNKPFYDQLNYCIIEKSPVMQECEKAHLQEKVCWHNSMEELGGITGCVISNELTDHFAVHRVVMQDELMEVFVDYNDGFVEVLKPAAENLITYLAELNVVLPKGFHAEINTEATRWIMDTASSLQKGYVLTIDYGYTSNELYDERRKTGTLMCYNKHSVNDNPYYHIGEQDITSHVNFSALCHWGFKHGLNYCGLTKQANFLLSLGFKEYLRKAIKGPDIISRAKQESYITRMLLVEMGSKFKVLIQGKGVPESELLGMKLSGVQASLP